jgi:hypothetical protein
MYDEKALGRDAGEAGVAGSAFWHTYLKGLRSGKEVVAFSMKFPGPPFLLAWIPSARGFLQGN